MLQSTTMLLAVLAFCAVLFPVQGNKTSNVAFSAAFEGSVFIPVNQIVAFPKVFTNIGNAYNSATGIFTATKTGVYLFNLNIKAQHSRTFCFRLFHKEVRSISVCGGSNEHFAVSSNSVVLLVKSGESVYWRAYHDSYVYGNADNHYSAYTGYLISLEQGARPQQ